MAEDAKLNGKTIRAEGIRTFEMVQYLSGWPKSFPEDGVGTMDDLPANLQDTILKAMEVKSLMTGLALSVVSVRMAEDVDKPKDDPWRVYLHVILSEVVMIDTAQVTKH